MVERVQVNLEVLKWAIKESSIPMDVVLEKNDVIYNVLYKDKYPTFKQLKDVSNFLKVPFGMLFLDKPPSDEMFKAEFRTINNKLNDKISKNLRDTILEMDYRKSWMSDYRKYNGYDKITLPKVVDIKNLQDCVQLLYNILKVDVSLLINQTSSMNTFNLIRERVEDIGILVMLNGVVGNDTHRILDVSEFRAFVLRDEYSPLIFINRNDTVSGMLFSLIHEFIHLLIGEDSDGIFISYEEKSKEEGLINNIVAEFLLPSNILYDEFDSECGVFNEIRRLSNKFNISPTVIAIKSYNLGLINEDVKKKIIDEAIINYIKSKSIREERGGNFYYNVQHRISKSFYATVIHQAEGGLITFKEAYKLLSLNGKTYDNFKKILEHKLYD